MPEKYRGTGIHALPGLRLASVEKAPSRTSSTPRQVVQSVVSGG